MNSHENHSNHRENNSSHKKHMSHGLLMVLCCLIPVVILLALPLFNIQSPQLRNILSFSIFLLCPLMHIFMMKGMHKKEKE